jgi:hypothetical protein
VHAISLVVDMGSVLDHALLRERQGLIIVVNSGELHHVVVGTRLVLSGVEVLDRSLLVNIAKFEKTASFEENTFGVLRAGVSLLATANTASFVSDALELRGIVCESAEALEPERDDTDNALGVGARVGVGVALIARVAVRLPAITVAVVRFATGAVHLAKSLVGVLVHDTPVVES